MLLYNYSAKLAYCSSVGAGLLRVASVSPLSVVVSANSAVAQHLICSARGCRSGIGRRACPVRFWRRSSSCPSPFRSHDVSPRAYQMRAVDGAMMKFDVRVAFDVALNRFGLRRNSDAERGRHCR